MRCRVLVLLAVFLLVGSVAGVQAQNTAQIYGKVTDASGAVLPGVTVTLTSPVLIKPLTAVTSESGSYQFPSLAVGTYNVRYELAGFKTIITEGVRIQLGENALFNKAMEISAVQETVTVSGETPIVDLKDTGRTSRFNQEALQSIPSARDPWVILEQAAGVAMDRQNVGGSASGQQSNFVARGAAMREQKWNLDGIDITDMSATGGSPVYYDFDAFEEMQISTGGADVTMQSPGVGVNLVTKSGTDKLRGSGRYYLTDDSMQSNNVTEDMRKQGVNTGNPIQKITDYGFEVGGPLKKGRAWLWGSYGRQDINVGINNFYKADANCQAMKAAPLTYSLEDLWTCLNSDTTILNNYNAKFAMQFTQMNRFDFFFNGAEKVRNARDASDLRPLETTYRQLGVTRADLGSSWWKTGMPKTYKWSDRHVFNDRFMMEFSYAHVGNNFALTFHEEDLRDVQPAFDIGTSAYARSYLESVYVRPTDSIDILGNYFIPGWLGGDHALKFGFKYRNDIAHSETTYGGKTIARFTSFATMAPSQAQMYRDSITEYQLFNRNLYIQDSITRNKMTINLGLRFDYQNDEAHEANVAAHPFYGKATYAGVYSGVTYTGATFNQLPALTFPGADSGGLSFQNWSPRLGFTYDLVGDGRNVVKLNYSRYVSQLGSGTLSSTYNTVNTASIRYPWIDVNNDQFVQANEVVLTATPLTYGGNYDPNNPTAASSPGTNDPNLKAATTDEFLIGFDKAIGNQFAISASYIWRNYANFQWSDRVNFSSADYAAVQYTPTCTVVGARCDSITYYQPTKAIPAAYVYTMLPDYSRGYQGFEISARKRMSHRWTANISYSYNDAPQHYDSPNSYEDPTNITNLNGGQYAPESTSSGLGNVFVNAKWIFRASGVYQTPLWDINVAGFYNSRSGYPFIQSIQTPSRANSAGITSVYLDRLGDLRLPTYQGLDFRVDKAFTIHNRVKIVPAMDIFNLLNGNTSLSIRGTQNANNANTISSILAPRVIRFGVRVTF
jgi:hypothetical protein